MHCVCAGHLLTDHQANRKKCALPVSRNCPHLPHQILEASIADKSALVVKLVLDLSDLTGDVRVGSWKGANTGEGSRGLIPAILASEPTRRLVAEPHRAEKEDSWETLHDERDDVLRVALQVGVRTVVDPKGEHDTGGDEELIDASQATTNGARGIFGNWESSW